MSALCDAVCALDLPRVCRLLEQGHDPNGVRQPFSGKESEFQPNTPLKTCVFRLSDCMLTDKDQDTVAAIAQVLIDHNADPVPASAYAVERYGPSTLQRADDTSNNSNDNNGHDNDDDDKASDSANTDKDAGTSTRIDDNNNDKTSNTEPPEHPWKALVLIDKAAKLQLTSGKDSTHPPPAAATAAAAVTEQPTVLAPEELYPGTISIISWNVLIPNSKDGWWIFKMYGPNTPKGCHVWEEREALLHKHLVGSGADILALQETAEWSIDTDWEFLRTAGYDRAVYKKDRMRPSTFWKRENYELWGTEQKSVLHTDRAVTTMLRPRYRELAEQLLSKSSKRDELLGQSSDGPLQPPMIVVLNCHLKAGMDAAKRRVQQIHKALEKLRKALAALETQPSMVGIIVCGDFNSGGRTAVRHLLVHEEILPSFIEYDEGEGEDVGVDGVSVTSKPKRHIFGRFRDTALGPLVGDAGTPPTPESEKEAELLRYTVVYRPLVPLMLHEDHHHEITARLRAALNACFDLLSGDGNCLTLEEQNNWLLTINGRLDRGAEMRHASELRQADRTDIANSPPGQFSRQDFIAVYTKVVMSGGFQGMDYDIRVLLNLPGGLRDFTAFDDDVADTAIAPKGDGSKKKRVGEDLDVYAARYDYIYCTDKTLEVVRRTPPVDEPRLQRLLSGEETLPNHHYPSDHLPVSTTLQFR